MAAAYPTLCCYSLDGFDGCIAGCVTLATRLFLSVALCEFIKYIRLFEETAFLLLGAYNGDIPVHVYGLYICIYLSISSFFSIYILNPIFSYAGTHIYT